jgi:hypothetical protein
MSDSFFIVKLGNSHCRAKITSVESRPISFPHSRQGGRAWQPKKR